MFPQLPLPLGLKDSAVFANFVAGGNTEAVAYLQRLIASNTAPSGTSCTYLHGRSGAGKSHLLQALCHAAGEAVYLPLRDARDFPPAALDGLQRVPLVCLDDIQSLPAERPWQGALFSLMEHLQHTRHRLVVTGTGMPRALNLLPDIASRLTSGVVFQIEPLAEPDRLAALNLRARRRGLNLPAPAANFLVRHLGHDMALLFERFEQLDRASLAAKRRVTVPFIREVLGTRASDA